MLVVATLLGYVIGSIPIANLVARRTASVDLRDVGDRNPGYWNAKETLGRRAAAVVFAGDVAKGSIAAGVGWLAAGDGDWGAPYVATGAAMLGHAYPVFAGFRGGRSVLTFVGGALVYAPFVGAVAIVIAVIAWALTRSFAWAARTGVVAFPVVQLVVDGPYRTAATGVLMTFIGFRFLVATRQP